MISQLPTDQWCVLTPFQTRAYLPLSSSHDQRLFNAIVAESALAQFTRNSAASIHRSKINTLPSTLALSRGLRTRVGSIATP